MPTDIGGAESMSPSMYAGSVMESFKPQTASPWAVWVAMLCCLGAGSFDSIAGKWMNMQYLPTCDTCEPTYFEAPFLQTFVMYTGEALCIVIYWVDDLIAKHKGTARVLDLPSAESIHKPKSPLWVWAIPTCIDFVASTMINYAMILALASTVQLLRNFNIVITALLTIVYLRRPLMVSHWVGVVIITIGMILTSLYAIINPDTSNNFDDSLSWLGIVLSIVGTIMSSFQFVFEERLLRKYFMPPLKAVGVEGITGMFVAAIALVVVQFAGWEDVKGAFYQMGHDGTLVAATLLYGLMITGFNASGLTVTKLGSGLLRAVIVAARSVTIWIVELCLGWNTFDGLDFSGLVVITIGVLLYNNVYPTRCCPAFSAFMHKEVPCGKLAPATTTNEVEPKGDEITVTLTTTTSDALTTDLARNEEETRSASDLMERGDTSNSASHQKATTLEVLSTLEPTT